MFEYFRRKRNLLKEMRVLDNSYQAQLNKETDEGTREYIVSEWTREAWEVEDQLKQIDNYQLIDKAKGLGIGIPSINNRAMWDPDAVHRFGNTLSEAGILFLKNEIRKRKREDHEMHIRRALVLTGIIGALTGIFAILYSR